MAVLKQTSPTAWPVAPRPKHSSTVPSASTSSAVAVGSVQASVLPSLGCVSLIESLNLGPLQSSQIPRLVPRTRSSHDLAARVFANFGFKSGTRIIGLLVSLDSEVRFERAASSGELRNRDTSANCERP